MQGNTIILCNDGNPNSEWYGALTGMSVDNSQYDSSQEEIILFIEKLKAQGNIYIAVNQDSNMYHNNIKCFENYVRIYNNGYYGIYKIQ